MRKKLVEELIGIEQIQRQVIRMRLIDADEVINILKETGIIQDNELGHCVIAEINRIPTAYDVDKVVQKLNEQQNNKGFGGTLQEMFYDSGLDVAIKIVKAGGTND